ncbi:MAG: TetR/AcrR family transcriptional regulator [Clostridia bacterium]
MSPRVGLDLPTILQAATEIADTAGIQEVTLASLAKKLKIRPPSLYNHVQGLSGLRKQMSFYGLDQLHEELVRATVGRSGDEAVRAMGHAYVAFARRHPGLYEATLLMDVDVQVHGKKVVDLVLLALQAYAMEEEEALHTVRGLRSLFHGFVSLEQKGGFGMPLDLDVSFRLLLDTFLSGLQVRQKRASS